MINNKILLFDKKINREIYKDNPFLYLVSSIRKSHFFYQIKLFKDYKDMIYT